ncbi:hypothetical protein [Lysinibacillus yapensis]|uniref:hypothetical protein n=1 Tax=Ureibacillus yapensis TaxID=2304605 RepID=UPI001314A14E|nr:hypothetical protein [Lysinibacillus yapensis]
MTEKSYAEVLKEINNRANEVSKEVEVENDKSIKTAIITEFGNDAFQRGVDFALNKK